AAAEQPRTGRLGPPLPPAAARQDGVAEQGSRQAGRQRDPRRGPGRDQRVFSMLTVLILTLYFLGSLPSITGFMYRLAPRSRRARVALLGDEILTRIGGYVADNLRISLIAGLT